MISIEAIVLGRNDDYEPNWNSKLFASIAHNRRLFEGTGIDFRVAFVEWNPPDGKPLLAESLVSAFPFVRVVVVDPAVHRYLCQDPSLNILINFSCNVALRSSAADYCVITGGDEFFGTALRNRIVRSGLEPGCLYRAERVNVREDIDFTSATTAVLEDPANVVSIDASSEPPYTNACGDFLLLDRATMNGMRGLDEAIRGARLHVDSRFAINAMIAGARCEMLGQIFHINHGQSYINVAEHYPGREYRWDLNLPYVNPKTWGLDEFTWENTAERIEHVRLPLTPGKRRVHPIDSDLRAISAYFRLRVISRRLQPEHPREPGSAQHVSLSLTAVRNYPDWGSAIETIPEGVRVETSPRQWTYAIELPLGERGARSRRWAWLALRLGIQGGIGVAFLTTGGALRGERFLAGDGASQIFVPIPEDAETAIFRNVAPNGASGLTLLDAAILLESRVQEA